MAWSTTVVVGIWMTCLALLFMAVGFSIPFWFVMSIAGSTSTKTFYAYTSVWYFMACEDGVADSCKSEPIEPKFTPEEGVVLSGDTVEDIVTLGVTVFGHIPIWWVVQIGSTVAVGLVLLASLILICCRCAGIHSKGFFVIAAIFLFFGGIISLGVMALQSISLALLFTFIPDGGLGLTATTFPWSVLLFGIGSILALVAFVIIMIITCKWKKLGSYYESDKASYRENGAPMSNLSKSYDRPRKPSDSRRGYERRDDQYSRSDFSRSKKYKESDRDYTRAYDNSYDHAYNYNRGYDKAYDSDRAYSQTRGGDMMYRPYEQYRY